ncbi:MAG: hypothetical protein JSW52_07040 [Candidatus Coatesbacteria bacterium]|nr:MAG: hypothetical protein JSW52_07040 [Candidatus Coatesbacteria bacterium]
MDKKPNLVLISLITAFVVGSAVACCGDIAEKLPFDKDEDTGIEGHPYTGGGTPPGDVVYAGGDGTSLEKAVIIVGASGEFEGVDSEYTWLEIQFGPENVNWRSLGQELIIENGRYYDILNVEFLTDVGVYDKGDVAEFYFDITDFYGKF